MATDFCRNIGLWLWVPLSRERLAERLCVRSRRMTGFACRVGVDVGAFEQIVETADAIPAISVGFEQQRVLAGLIGLAVVFRQQVDQKLAGVAGETGCKRVIPRLLIE